MYCNPTNAEELEKGMLLTDAEGQAVAVEKTEKSVVSEEVLVYNFHVEEFCSYFVSDCSVLVHNSSDKKTADEIIGEKKKAAINREFPNEWRKSCLDEIEKAAKQGNKSAQKAKKLLNDKRFDKTDNRK